MRHECLGRGGEPRNGTLVVAHGGDAAKERAPERCKRDPAIGAGRQDLTTLVRCVLGHEATINARTQAVGQAKSMKKHGGAPGRPQVCPGTTLLSEEVVYAGATVFPDCLNCRRDEHMRGKRYAGCLAAR